MRTLLFVIGVISLLSGTRADPDVFCKSFGSDSNNDFCVTLSTHINTATHKQDFIFTYNRTQQHAAGWTAFAIGNHMDDSLMFILYGDPDSPLPPTLSVRSTTHHEAPVTLAMGDQHHRGIHVGYLDVQWEHSERPQSRIASASFTCYGCNAWYNADISASTPVLPMIWAINTNQDLSAVQYSGSAPLLMHDRYGSFDLDMNMETTVAPPTLPDTIVHNIGLSSMGGEGDRTVAGTRTPSAEEEEKEEKQDERIATSADPADNPRYILSHRQLWIMHGLLLASAFYVLLPSGALFLHLKTGRSFQLHLGLQVAGSLTALVGMGLGFLLSHQIAVWHQFLGIFLGTALLAQMLLGWAHHIEFMRSQGRTWMSHCHVWLGWAILLLGWINLVLGLHLSDYTTTLKAWFSVFACLEFGCLMSVTYRHRRGTPLTGVSMSLVSSLLRRKKVRWAATPLTDVPSGPIDNSRYSLTADDEGESSDNDNSVERDIGHGKAREW